MQGRGIFLINKLAQVKRWEKPLTSTPTKPIAATASATAAAAAKPASQELYVVSRYIDNPLLVASKKFDLRLYVLVTSFKPLKVYMSDLGFARFCNVKYDVEEVRRTQEHPKLTIKLQFRDEPCRTFQSAASRQGTCTC